MKAYGLTYISSPDIADIHAMVAKSSCGTSSGPSGDHRGIHKNKAAKAATRRTWARRARNESKALCKDVE